MISICIYVLFIFICDKNNQNTTRLGNELSNKNSWIFLWFLGFEWISQTWRNSILVEATYIWQDLLKLAMHNQNEYQDGGIKNIWSWDIIVLTSGETQTFFEQLQNTILWQNWHTWYRLPQSHKQMSHRNMREHDSWVLDDKSKQIFI